MAQLKSTNILGNLTVTGDIATPKIVLPKGGSIYAGGYQDSIAIDSLGDIRFSQGDPAQTVHFEGDKLYIGSNIYGRTSGGTIFFESAANFASGFNSDGDCTIDGTLEATSFNATSDARLKENFEKYCAQTSILELPIYKYDYIDGAKNQIGCLAQDLQQICPEIVQTREDGYLTIQESKIVYLLIEEIKQLKEEIRQLKGE